MWRVFYLIERDKYTVFHRVHFFPILPEKGFLLASRGKSLYFINSVLLFLDQLWKDWPSTNIKPENSGGALRVKQIIWETPKIFPTREKLITPRVNPESMEIFTQRIKERWHSLCKFANVIVTVGCMIAKSTEIILKARNNAELKKFLDTDELITFHTDALALLGHTQCEISSKRRDKIKPVLNKEYAGVCSTSIPTKSLLFGDDLQQELSNIRASNRVVQSASNAKSSLNKHTSISSSRPFWQNRPEYQNKKTSAGRNSGGSNQSSSKNVQHAPFVKRRGRRINNT